MKQIAYKLTVTGLVTINIVLLASLCFRSVQPNTAIAQPAAARSTEYMTIGALANGTPPSVLYILDPAAGRLSFARFEDATGEVTFSPAPVDLEKIFAQGAANGQQARPVPRR